jgi:hypothetical protein
MEGEGHRNRQWFADRDSNADVAEPPVAVRGLSTDPDAPSPPLNSSQRLDALARLLDRRLKQVDDAAGASHDTTGGGP